MTNRRGGGGIGRPTSFADFTFDPNTVTVPSGRSVHRGHDADESSTASRWTRRVSEDVEEASTTVTLSLTEGIGWHCKYHPEMTGTVTVPSGEVRTVDAIVVQSTTAEAYGDVPARYTLSASIGAWRKSASRLASSSERLIAHSGRSVTHIENRT